MSITYNNSPRISGLTCEMDDGLPRAFAAFLTAISCQRPNAKRQGT